jgi:hypothetical protein
MGVDYAVLRYVDPESDSHGHVPASAGPTRVAVKCPLGYGSFTEGYKSLLNTVLSYVVVDQGSGDVLLIKGREVKLSIKGGVEGGVVIFDFWRVEQVVGVVSDFVDLEIIEVMQTSRAQAAAIFAVDQI